MAIQPSVRSKIRRLHRQRFKLWVIARDCGVSIDDVRALLASDKPRRVRCSPRLELRAEGASPDVIAACFGGRRR